MQNYAEREFTRKMVTRKVVHLISKINLIRTNSTAFISRIGTAVHG